MSFIRADGVSTVISSGLRPVEGPRSVLYKATIVGGAPASATIDLKTLNMSCIQTVFIDNSRQSLPVTLSLMPIGQTITAQANTQGFYQALCPIQTLTIEVDYAGDAVVPIRFINVAMEPFTYSAQPPVLTVQGTVSTIPPAVQAVSQSGAWTVGQSSPFSVSQFGAWNVGQSGAWNVGQSGAWNVGQAGIWNVRETGAQSVLPGITGATQVVAGASRLWAVTFFAGAAGNVYDNNGVAANTILPLPAAGGTVTFPGGWPISTGIYVVPGAGQTVCVSYT